ncbi:MAG: pilus assembly protein PilM [Pirellulaceae bacterium]|nr:pilus assembly protein PilM [Pirellulaceae bacterium]
MDISKNENTEPPSTRDESESGGARVAVIRCHSCDQLNTSTQKFCTHCGQLLWEPCVVCATCGPVGQVYCGSCGTHLDTARQKKADEFARRIEDAKRLRAEAKLDVAIETLQSMIDVSYSCVAKEVQQAKSLLRQYREQLQEVQAKVGRTAAIAQKWLSEANYQAALTLLRSVPEPVRSSAIVAMLAKAEASVAEITQLEAEVGEAMKSRITVDLPAKVNRLMELQPGSDRSREWARRLRDQFLRAAVARAGRFEYDKAEELLRAVPTCEQDVEVEKLAARTSILADLDWAVRKAPFVDAELRTLAELLRKWVPNHPEAEAWIASLAQREAARAKDPRRGLPRWADPPAMPRLGHAIDAPTGFERIAVSDSCVELLCSKGAGRFYAACGLALQGLRRGVVGLNLVPAGRGSLLSRMARLRIGGSSPRAAWGLDLGASGLKAVKLVVDGGSDAIRVESCHLVDYPKSLDQAVDVQQRRSLIAEALATFRDENPTEDECICAAVPGRHTFCRGVSMPVTNQKKRAAAMAYEAQRAFPFPLDDVVWGYQTLRQIHLEDSNSNCSDQILLVAAKRSLAEEYLLMFEQAGLSVDVLQSDPIAILNHFSYEGHLRAETSTNAMPPDGASDAVVIVDLGGDATNFFALSDHGIWFHSAGLGSEKITRSLTRHFDVTLAEAEKLKRSPAAARNLRKWNEATQPVFEDIEQEIVRSLGMFTNACPKARVERILAVGGGFRTHGLLRYLYLGR